MNGFSRTARIVFLSAIFISALWLFVIQASFRRVAGQGVNNSVAVVSAASFASTVAPDSIASVYGAKLATGTDSATTLPLPTQLAGTTVTIADVPAPLFFVSPGQLNLQIPPNVPLGDAKIAVRAGDGTVSTGTVRIARAAPGLFTANSSGSGVPAAVALRVKADGSQSYEQVADFAQVPFSTRPLDFGAENDQLFLILFGTGIRGRTTLTDVAVRIGGVAAAVSYAGDSGSPGLDQINVLIPRALQGRGRVNVALNINGYGAANLVEIEIAGAANITPPQVLGYSAVTALAGQQLTVNGSDFSPIAAENTVRTGGVEARVEIASATQLTIRVPFGAQSGVISVRTPTGEGQGAQALQMRTSISGVVEDTRRQPLAGVTVRVVGQGIQSVTGAEGSFILPDVLPTLAQELEFDGGTVPGSLAYPKVRLKKRVLASRDNQMDGPIALQQISGPGVQVGNAGAAGALAAKATSAGPTQIPAQTVRAGNVTFDIPAGVAVAFPNGATRGMLNLTLVENSRPPVSLPPGLFSTTIPQLTPFSAVLLPGGKLTLPNDEKAQAGTQVKLFRFDQTPNSPTLGSFVEAGAATVSADGLRIETAPNAITEITQYFVATPRQTTTVVGRVVDSNGVTPVRQALVRCRGQEAFTDGNGGFTLPGVVVNPGDILSVEASFVRANGRVDRTQRSGIPAVVNGLTVVTPDLVLPAEDSNRPPVLLAPASLRVNEAETREVNFVAADPDPGQTIQVAVTGASFASVIERGNNIYSLRLQTRANDAGQYTLMLTATDNLGLSNTLNLALTVNRAPVANPQTVTTDEGVRRTITLTGSDPEGDPFSFSIVNNPSHGDLSQISTGSNSDRVSVTYTPALGYFGIDSFSFKVNDGQADSQPAIVFIVIIPINHPPTLAVPSARTVNEGEVLSFIVSASDIDVTQTLSFTATELPGGASFQQISDTRTARFGWTPNFAQAGSYTVIFKVTDNGVPALSDTKTVALTVIDVNRAPVANAANVATDEDTPLSITLTGSDPDGDKLTFAIVTPPAKGALTGTVPNLTYTPSKDFNGSDSFTFKTNDGKLDSALATITITVRPVNDPPVATPQQVTTDEDTPIAIKLTGTDVDGDALTFIVVTPPAKGALSGMAPNLTYTPNKDYNGADSFTFKVNDGALDSVPATITITVNPVNDAPVLTVPGPRQAIVGDPLRFVVTATDVDNNTVRIEARDLPPGASFSQATGEFSWTPRLEQRAATPYKVTFSATDNGTPPLSDSRQVEISVNEEWRATNGPPGGTVLALAVSGPNLFAGTAGGIYVSGNNGASWTLLNGLRGYSTRALLVRPPRIFAGTENGVYVSENNGANWRRVSTGLPSTGLPANAVLALAADNQNQIFAGTYGGGVYVTNNAGALWTSLSDGLPVKPGTTSKEVYALTVNQGRVFAGTNEGVYALNAGAPRWSPSDNGLPGAPHVYSLLVSGSNLYAATNDGIFVTGDNGASWKNISNGLPVNTAATSVTVSGSTVFAGTYSGGVYALSSNAATWAPLSNGLAELHILSLAALGNNVFAGTEGAGVFVAAASVSNWTPINNGLTTPTVLALAAGGATLFAGTFGGGVYVSADNGANWTPLNNGLASRQVYALAVNGNRVFAGTNDGVFVTANGADWSPSANGMPGAPNVYALKAAGGKIWAGTNKGIFVTADSGASWNRASDGLPNGIAVTAFAASADKLFAGTYGGGVYVTGNQGATWAPANGGLTNAFVLSLAIAGGKVFAGTQGGGIFVSANSGTSWTPVKGGLPAAATVISLLASGESLWAGLEHSGVYVTTNQGASWAPFNNGLALPTSVAALLVKENALFAGSDKGAIVSSNHVTTWRPSSDGLIGTTALALAVNNENVFAGTYGGGAFIAENDGTAWTPINNGLARNRIFSLFSSGGVLLAGTNDGVYASYDNGVSWSESNSGLTGLPQVYALVSSGRNVFAATNDGVFLTTDNGASWTVVSNGLPADKAILSLAVNGSSSFAGTYQGGLFVTTNNGLSWSRADNGMPPATSILALAVSEANVFAGTDKGVFVTNNNGGSWISANNGLPPGLLITSLAVSGNSVFAGTYGAGLFVTSNNGVRWNPVSRGISTNPNNPNNPGNPAIIVSSLVVKQTTLFAGITGQGVFVLKF